MYSIILTQERLCMYSKTPWIKFPHAQCDEMMLSVLIAFNWVRLTISHQYTVPAHH